MRPGVAGERVFTADDFRRRALRETGPFAVDEFGDHRLNPGLRDMIVRDGLRDAAVLVPVVDHGPEATVLLTQRNANLRSHSGQVAFPGGRIDAGDASAEAAALRETMEEIGLPGERVEVIGRLPDYVTGSGYRIAPVLSVVKPGFHLHLNPAEVDAAFEVPLSFLMDPANHHRQSRTLNEVRRYFYEMPFGERYIWGVTAGIIRTLYERLYA
ncbi:MAG: CoA pyrophosphatase [Rhizobiales bacterium]|nr:CoA pyrophosphatase [Hyphomicrobiales bacterium]OJU31317.1 MAG: coenzyme A pyrophosphatase [Rhizobiales bacterium 68-8]